jgi:UDP-3-O-[3-hydroxymyristoyl] glucosamine N-acyltransferase
LVAGARAVRDLAAHVGGEVVGDPDRLISSVSGLAEAGPNELSFLGNARYRRELDATHAGAVLVSEVLPPREGTSWIRVAQPHLAFARISQLFHPFARPPPGVSPRAQVHPSAKVHPSASVLGLATVEAGASIGAGTVLYPGAYVGEGAQVGEGCLLFPNVVVRERCRVGNRVILQPGCVVGSDGFGFAFDAQGPSHVKVPQAGIVRIEDDVELGANTCIDRATFGETVVGRGAKLDNLVQIAHNVKVGPLAILCAQVGVSGSTEIGQGTVLAGQVGVVGHLKLGNRVTVGAQSGVSRDLEDGETVSGSPAIPHREWLRAMAALKQLPELVQEVRSLKKRIAELEEEKGE